MTATIQTRVDSNLKKQADSLFASFGLDTTSAIRLFLTQAVNQKRLPFEVVAPRQEDEEFNDETIAAMEEARAISEGRIKAKSYSSFKEAMADIGIEL